MGMVYLKGVGTIVLLLLDRLSRTFTLWYAIVPHSLNNNPLSSWELKHNISRMGKTYELSFANRRAFEDFGRKSFNELTLVPRANYSAPKWWHKDIGHSIRFYFLRPCALQIYWVELYCSHDIFDSALKQPYKRDFDTYIYHLLYYKCSATANYLIWDEYGIDQYDNIQLTSISPNQLNLDKCNFLKDYMIYSNANCYVTNEDELGNNIQGVIRIKNNCQFLNNRIVKESCGRFQERKMMNESFYEKLSNSLPSMGNWYKEISLSMDFNWLDLGERQIGCWNTDISADNIEIDCSNRGIPYGFKTWHIELKGNDELRKEVQGQVNRKKQEKLEEKEQVERIEAIKRREEDRRRRYNTIHRHSRDGFISFDETNHTYTVDGKSLQSVTNLVENCFPKFDTKLHAENTAAKMCITPQEVIDMWERQGKESRELGTTMHQKIESYYQGQDSGEDDAFRLFKVFAEKVKLEPYRTEWAVYDTDYNIAGTIDFVDCQNGIFTIYDWKRSDKIIANGMPVKVSKYQEKGLYPLEHLENCAYYHYALQLSLYKFILERNYDMKISKLRLGIFHPSYDKPYMLEMPYLENEVKMLMDLRSEVIL